RGVVDAVAGHGDHVAARLENVDEVDLVLGRHAGDDADAVDPAPRIRVVHRGELRAADGASLDAKAPADGLRGDGVVAGDHADLHARGLCPGDGVRGLGPRRVQDADQREQREAVELAEQVAGGIESHRIEVLAGGRYYAQTLPGEHLVALQIPGA